MGVYYLVCYSHIIDMHYKIGFRVKIWAHTLFLLFPPEAWIVYWAQAWKSVRCELLVHAYKIHRFWTNIRIPRKNLIMNIIFLIFLQKLAIMMSASVKNRSAWFFRYTHTKYTVFEPMFGFRVKSWVMWINFMLIALAYIALRAAAWKIVCRELKVHAYEIDCFFNH